VATCHLVQNGFAIDGDEAQATIERALAHIEQLNRDEQALRARCAEGDQDASLPAALEQQLRELGYLR
jgi:hypothetical protein